MNQIAALESPPRLIDFDGLTLEGVGQSLIGLLQSLSDCTQLLADAVNDFGELVQSVSHLLVGCEELILCGAVSRISPALLAKLVEAARSSSGVMVMRAAIVVSPPM